MKKIINLVCTGGTIEKIYYDGIMVNETSSDRVEKMIKRINLPHIEYRIHRIMNKDSLYLTNEDRENIKNFIRDIMRENKGPIIIIHGTDTMVNTGLFLKKRFVYLDVPIVLTGAMIPFGFEDSDSIQNLTESLMAAQLLNSGVYIVFHGDYFDIENVVKNKKEMIFEKIK